MKSFFLYSGTFSQLLRAYLAYYLTIDFAVRLSQSYREQKYRVIGSEHT